MPCGYVFLQGRAWGLALSLPPPTPNILPLGPSVVCPPTLSTHESQDRNSQWSWVLLKTCWISCIYHHPPTAPWVGASPGAARTGQWWQQCAGNLVLGNPQLAHHPGLSLDTCKGSSPLPGCWPAENDTQGRSRGLVGEPLRSDTTGKRMERATLSLSRLGNTSSGALSA